MLGFAIVDSQPTAGVTAVWLTSRDGTHVGHTNAVVLSTEEPRHDATVAALVADRVVVLTEGSTAPLPFAHPVSISALDELVAATHACQQAIVAAVEAARDGKRSLTVPKFAPTPPRLDADGDAESAQRALATANYVAQLWEAWLVTDDQRAARSGPRSPGRAELELPPIMRGDLCDRAIRELPQGFADPEPLSVP